MGDQNLIPNAGIQSEVKTLKDLLNKEILNDEFAY